MKKWKTKARQLRKQSRAATKAEKKRQRKYNTRENKHKFERSNKMVYDPTSHKEWLKPAVVEEEYWETEIEIVKDCSKAPNEVIIWICPLAKVKIDALMEKFPSIEWFSYMLGKKGNEKDPRTIVEDIYIPKQTVTSTSVDEIDAPDFNNLPIIGALHSSHTFLLVSSSLQEGQKNFIIA